jgi:outer membrane beta-barrel protein
MKIVQILFLSLGSLASQFSYAAGPAGVENRAASPNAIGSVSPAIEAAPTSPAAAGASNAASPSVEASAPGSLPSAGAGGAPGALNPYGDVNATAATSSGVPAANTPSPVVSPNPVSSSAPVVPAPSAAAVAPVTVPSSGSVVSPATTNLSSQTGGTQVPASDLNPQRLETESLKHRYWDYDLPEFNVVQNREYKKAGRLNAQVLVGTLSHDPFLVTQGLGLSVGMNLSENIGINLMYWAISEASSPAVAALRDAENAAGVPLYAVNVNPITSLLAAEASWSIFYGKLSFIGKMILHFDFFLTGGVGSMGTQNGAIIAPWLGVGEQIYLTRFLALRADYRYLIYSESLIERNDVSTKGNILNSRTTQAPVFSLGLSFYLF